MGLAVGSGTATVMATYGPATSNSSSSYGTESLSIAPASTTTTVSCTSDSVQAYATTSCTGTVSGGYGSISGETITWSQSGGNGSVSFSSPTCSLSGASCSVTVNGTGVGKPVIQASYPGDSNNNGSSATLTLTVASIPTTTSFSCLTYAITTGSSTTCTATVADGGQTPSGSVTFSAVSSDTGRVAFSPGTCPLLNGSCSVTVIGVTSGSATVTATYGPDTSDFSSSNATEGLAIIPATPTTTPPPGGISSPVAAGATTFTTAVSDSCGSMSRETMARSQFGGIWSAFSSSACGPSDLDGLSSQIFVPLRR